MIPDAAVEAAGRTLESCLALRIPLGEMARAALEAAAPHMLARAWEAGREVGLSQDFEATTQIANPYLLAQAWDAGIRAGIRCDGTHNPYRSNL